MEVVQSHGGGEGGKRGPPETENLLCGRGQQRCNEDCDWHQPGVMLHQLRGWEREEKVSQTKNGAWNNQGKADPTPGSAGLIYSLLFLVYSSANLSPEKMQSSPTAHCTLFFTTGYTGVTAADCVAATRAGETWDPATSRVCKQDMAAREVCVLCKKLCSSLTLTLASCFACVWSMLISYC